MSRKLCLLVDNEKFNPWQNCLQFQNTFVQRFFSISKHLTLLHAFLKDESPETRKELEEEFRRFYFEVRFTKYLSSTIKYVTIDFLRKRKITEQRNPLIFDTPLEENNETTLGEFLAGRQLISESKEAVVTPLDYVESFENELLYKAFLGLTQRQKLVITLSYALCFLDREIADYLAISKQAVSKTRAAALAKMRETIFWQYSLSDYDKGKKAKKYG
mgnify:CR=1 FL=1